MNILFYIFCFFSFCLIFTGTINCIEIKDNYIWQFVLGIIFFILAIFADHKRIEKNYREKRMTIRDDFEVRNTEKEPYVNTAKNLNKKETLTVALIVGNKERSANLLNFSNADPRPKLKASLDLTDNGNLFISICFGYKQIGKLSQSDFNHLEKKYGSSDGFDCQIEIANYRIYEKNDALACDITLDIYN